MTIDIVMPFYGDVAQFRDAVESVLAQTDDRWRLTVIDDCYPGTAHVDYMASVDDDRVSMMRNPRNLGVAGTFQRSIEVAEAEHLVIMGCDDLLHPGYVARMHELLTLFPDASYLQPGVRVIGDDGTPTRPLADRVKAHYRPGGRGPRALRGEELALSLLRGNWTYFPSILWRRDVVTRFGFRPDFEVVLDLALQFDIAADGGELVVDDEEVFSYRRHDASVSSATAVKGARFAEERAFFDEAEGRCRALGWERAARAARHHWSSRLNALTRLPGAARARDARGAGVLIRH
ncbi:MAG: glycosyltransferase, partial [Protaetiibacter sp.]